MEELDLTAHSRSFPTAYLRAAKAILFGLLLLVLGARSGSAQTATAPVEHLEVALWPEFDRQAMLVIYRFELPADTPLPARVALPVPAASGQPHAVAWQDAEGVLYDAVFTVDPARDWSVVEIELPESRQGRLEFYADMDFTGTLRSFLFEWPSGFELAGMSYQVQEPVAAADLRVVPEPEAEGPGDYGLNYLTAELGPQSADGAPLISVTYEKPTPALSVDALQPLGQASTPVDIQSDNTDLLPWLLAAVGVIVLGGGVYYFAFRRQPAPQRVSRRRRKRASDVELEVSTVYCHNCGAAAGISDMYCRQCGTQLRRS
jgi:hypothetical protein